MRKDPMGFNDYRKNSWWYAGKLTKKNFDEVAAFIERCTIEGLVKADKEAWTIQYKPNPRFAGNGPITAKLGDYVARNVGGGDYGDVLVLTPKEFKRQYKRNYSYSLLKYYDLTDVEYNVLRSILTQDCDLFYGYGWIEDYTGVDRKETKKAVDHLRELGILSYASGLMTEDGEVAGSGFGIDGATAELMAELLMRRKQDKDNAYYPDTELPPAPKEWWVTNHDAPADNKRVSGPYSTSHDAAKAREAIERIKDTNINYWIEELEVVA